jgi:hypothetical protein
MALRGVAAERILVVDSMNMYRSISASAFFIAFAVLGCFVVSCGLEEYDYVPSVTEAGGAIVSLERNIKATIQLPQSIGTSSFTNFAILYRIYLSGQSIDGQIQTSSAALSNINPTLASDYNILYPYTDITNSSASTGVQSVFIGRNYYTFGLAGTSINSELDSGSLGKTIVLDFSLDGIPPTLTIDEGTPYNLLRSSGRDDLNTKDNNPLPSDADPYFLNYSDLTISPQTATDLNNRDVAHIASSSQAYTALYIVAVGRKSGTLEPIYSKPAFIGILRLPAR